MTLDDLRRQLDGIDQRLMELIAERQSVIRKISQAKQSTGFPLRDYRREREVFQKARTNAEKVGVSPDIAEEVLRTLIRYSLTVQEQASMLAHRAGNGQRALVIGGAGKMGGWFAQFLYSQGFDVEIADPNAASGPTVIADWRGSDLQHDFIVVATPLGMTNEVLLELARRKPPGVIFDLGSLKSPLRTGLAALRAAGLRVTSAHPMFGPDVELLSGRHIILVDLGEADAVQRTRALFQPTMAELIVMSLDEHDKAAAYILGLSHAVNIAFFTALLGSGESAPHLVQLSSTTFNAQFEVARRVAQENPQLYYEIQHMNHYGRESLDRLAEAVQALRAASLDDNPQRFHELMNAGREYTENRRRNGERH